MRLSSRTVTRILGSPRLRRLRPKLTVFVVALAGAWLGLLVGAHVTEPVGPVDVRLSLRPSLTGGAVVDIVPLGTLELDTHEGPVEVVATVEQVRPEAVERIIADPQVLSGLADQVTRDLREGIAGLIMKSTMSAVVGAAVLGLVFFRRPERAGWSVLTCCAVVAATVGIGAATFNPRSLAEPRYTGLLASAPTVVGSAESIVHNFSRYSDQLVQIVTNVSRLYKTASALPVYEPDPATVRVLHVSDIHLNPTAWQVIRSVSKQFQVDVVVDTGDITDHGSSAESEFVDQISALDVPYVFVRGNHDSQATQEAVARERNAIVLDGEVREVAGLRFFGAGDPRYTPDKATREVPDAAALQAEGRRLADGLRAGDAGHVAGDPESVEPVEPVDVAVLHDPNEGRGFDGTVPLVLAGHAHRRSTEVLPRGTRLFVQGSTGGAGLRGLEHEQPTPVTCSVLYFDRETGRLQAWDDITLGGLGLASARIERHLEPAPDRAIGAPGASPAATLVPSGPSRPGVPVPRRSFSPAAPTARGR